MRIVSLTVAGFGPFKTPQHVDFFRFDDSGIFLITGKTGAGKSSILDAICYALYNSVPRYEGTQQQLRSDHSELDDPSFVELVFTTGDATYRVRRTPEYDRPKQRGTGTTKQAATALLERRIAGVGDEDAWQGIAARAVDVGVELDRILGLSRDQFLQVILLAQNRFQRFLQSGNDERQGVLRSLFGTRRFQRVEENLVERRKQLDAQLGSVREAVEQQAQLAQSLVGSAADADVADEDASTDDAPVFASPDWFGRLVALLSDELNAASSRAEADDAAVAAADTTLRALEAAAALQSRRDAARSRLAALVDAEPVVRAGEKRLLDARRAATVWSQLTAHRQAEIALESAVRSEQIARDAYLLLADDGTADRDGSATGSAPTQEELRARIDEITRLVGSLESLLVDEASLPELDERAAQHSAELERLTERGAAFTESVATLPGIIEGVAHERDDARLAAIALDPARDLVTRLATAVDAAGAAEILDEKYTAALGVEKAASSAVSVATLDLDLLLELRLSGHAAELAAQLRDGEPCAVCGATSHPAPAVGDGEFVTEASISTSRAAVARLRTAMDTATAVAQEASVRLTEARTRADGKSRDELAGELDAARESLSAAETALATAETLTATLERHRADLATATSGLESLAAERAGIDRTAAETAAERAAIAARVDAGHAGFASVMERVAALRARLAATQKLADAQAQRNARTDTLQSTGTELRVQLDAQGFAHADDVDAARLDDAAMTRLENAARTHNENVATAQATLDEAGMAGLVEDPVSTDDARTALAELREKRDTSLGALGSLRERHSQLVAVAARATDLGRESKDLQEEFQLLRELAAAVEGNAPNTKRMRLETYVLAAQLEEIVRAANSRLRTMTSGRFALEHNDGVQFRNTRSGLGLSILDQHTGRSRATHSLSGGETFLASLALALGLAEVVTNQAGGITLDTLFIDEGFGSLDSDTLEVAMSTLDSLRAGGRTIGLISHVDAMKEQIHAKLRITVTDQGYSEIETAVEA